MTPKETKFQAIKGVRDILPPDSALWNRVEQAAREVFATYGYGEIRLPVFEQTELFARSIGLDTDVVSKEMYSFEDRASGELARLREDIQDVLNLPSADPFDEAFKLLDAYNSLLSSPAVSQELPSDPGNLKLIEAFKDNFRVLTRTRNEPSPMQQELLVAYVRGAQGLVRAIQLGQSITLRPEATASVVRAYIDNGMQTLPSPIRLYYMGPMFRRERPQKGRYRQFYQIGVEVLGPNIGHFTIDAEVITMLMALFEKCGLAGHVLYINSIGCKECRPNYIDKLTAALRAVEEQLGPDSRRRIRTNPLRVLDSKLPEEQQIINRLPTLASSLCEECKGHFEGLQRVLRDRGVDFKVNPRLVRGLDYYVRTTFEVTAPGQGSQNAICGGGRYDGLVELIGGPKFRDIKGVGFAIGEDRLIEALKFQGIKGISHVDVLIAWKGEGSREHAEKLAQTLRLVGLAVEVPVKAMAPGEGLGLANRRGIPIGAVVGPEEVSAASFSVRLLSESDQVSLTESRASHIGRLLMFRVLLERKLQDRAILSNIDYKHLPIRTLAKKLADAGAIPGYLVMPISMASDTFTKLIHGVEVAQNQQSEAIAASLMVLDELSGKGPKLPLGAGSE